MKNAAILLIAILLQLFVIIPGFSDQVIHLNDNNSKFSLSSQIEYLIEKKKSIPTEDIVSGKYDSHFLKSKDNVLNFGFSNMAVWIKMTLYYSSGQELKEKKWYLELDYPLLDFVELHETDSSGGFSTQLNGDRYPFSLRKVPHRNPVFAIKTPANTLKTVYLKVQSGSSMKINLLLWTADGFFSKNQNTMFLYGIFYGVFFIMFFYNLFLFFSLNDRSYFFYIIYVYFYTLVRSSLDGFTTQFLWGEYTWWSNAVIPFFTLLVDVCCGNFFNQFSHTKQIIRRPITFLI